MRFRRFAGWACAIYDAGLSMVVWFILTPFELLRIAFGRSSRAALEERLGAWVPPVRVDRGRPLLVHAASVGEVAAATNLVAVLSTLEPSLDVILCTANREGRLAAEAAQGRVSQIVAVASLPWDRRRAVCSWLRRIDPCAVVVVETEIWPALFGCAKDLGIPLLVVNGRIGRREVSRYRLARSFFAKVLDAADWIGVQNAEHRDAFIAIGAPVDRIVVTGNLKLDGCGAMARIPDAWQTALDAIANLPREGTAVVVAGSTHDPEERWLVEAVRRHRENAAGTHLIVAPRHPRRAARVLKMASSSGLQARRWTDGPGVDWDVLVVDEIGPLARLYEWADVAVIGGSLVDGGGHNPAEAAAAGCAVLMGPSIDNVHELVRDLERAGGIKVLPAHGDRREALYDALVELLGDADLRTGMGEQAVRTCRTRTGAARCCAEAILSRIASTDRASTGTAPEPS